MVEHKKASPKSKALAKKVGKEVKIKKYYDALSGKRVKEIG